MKVNYTIKSGNLILTDRSGREDPAYNSVNREKKGLRNADNQFMGQGAIFYDNEVSVTS